MAKKIIYRGNSYSFHKDGYYKRTQSLHRRIWEDAHGEIPEDHHIHHKDGNKENNSLENLECISQHDHHSMHFSSEKQIKHLHSQREKAALWHRSEKGRKFHSHNAKTHWQKREPIERECIICNLKFQTKNFTGTKYCSQKCRTKSGYLARIVTIQCHICSHIFKAEKGKSKTCSPKCSAQLASKTRRHNDLISTIE